MFTNVEVETGTTVKHVYKTYNGSTEQAYTETLTLGVPGLVTGETVVIILLDADGDVYEYFTDNTPWETVQNFASYRTAKYMLYVEAEHYGSHNTIIDTAKRTRREFADCFDMALEITGTLPTDFVSGPNAIVKSGLNIAV